MQQQLSCPNCGNNDTQDSKFCSNCSQKTKLKLNNVGRMFLNFAAQIIDYDSKLFASIRGLFYPGLLTNEYLSFKRVQYLTPIRLFVYLMFVFFFLLSWYGYDSIKLTRDANGMSLNIDANSQVDEGNLNFLEKASTKMKLLSRIDTLIDELEEQKNITKTILSPEVMDKLPGDQDEDELDKPSLIEKNTEKLRLINSSINELQALREFTKFDKSDTFTFTFFYNEYKVETADLNTMTAQQLIDKYKVENWIEKLGVENFIKFNNDTNGFGKFIFQNLIWVIILDLLLMSLVFKLFYIRTKKLYVEHFIYHLHIRAFIFFIGIILLLLPFNLNSWVALVLSVSLLLYAITALIKVYNQSIIFTLFKFIILLVVEILIIAISFLSVMLVSSFVFKFF